MKRDMILKLAASAMAISVTLTGCGPFGGDSVASSSAKPAKPATVKDGARYAKKAEKALAKGQVDKAIIFAERSVAGVGNDPETRALLGQAYLSAGRFSSAERSFMDAMELGKNDARTILNLSMAQLAQGKADKAKRLIQNNREFIPVADYGLALALAGDSKTAVDVLTQAIRSANVTGRTRQNLGLAYALDGRWKEAKLMAMQDMTPSTVDSRIMQWAQMARPGAYQKRVATMLNVTPVANDPGQPVRLALNVNSAPVVAAATPAQDYSREVASFDRNRPLPAVGPAPKTGSPVDFMAKENNVKVATVETVAVPASAPKADKAVKAVKPVKPAPLIKAAAEPVRVAPEPKQAFVVEKVAAPSVTPKPVPVVTPAVKVVSVVKPILQKIAFKPSTGSLVPSAPAGSTVVQLGVFSSAENVKRAWNILSAKHSDLGLFQHSSSQIKVRGRTLYRLTAVGFGNDQAAKAMCAGIKSNGSNCIVRQVKGVSPHQMAAKTATRIASR
ncbi:hypothetical protein MNBD_ALPHA04-903 [hydrothermal vent metagenome]|uniref:SPOR domain-containing protein n=1 Tax=hydrothermal vent metagenome TaxID=652676 RepID=A0A3B0RE06_9ZZZZ